MIQDVASNIASAFSGQMVENLTPQPVYDTDADGLIEITTLAQLEAIRHDLDGDGTPTGTGATAYAAAFPDVTRVVCDTSSGRCEGYELMTALDFDTNGDGQVDADDTYWTTAPAGSRSGMGRRDSPQPSTATDTPLPICTSIAAAPGGCSAPPRFRAASATSVSSTWW